MLRLRLMKNELINIYKKFLFFDYLINIDFNIIYKIFFKEKIINFNSIFIF